MKKINIKGVIIPKDDKWIYDLFDIENVTPEDVNVGLEEANGDDVEAIINSPGGSVFSGSEIYTALKDYQGNVIVKIVGIAASAASVVAMAGNKTMMSPTAQMMIHNSMSGRIGDHRDMKHESGVLKTVDKTIANAYRLKSGMEEAELLNLMAKETWFTAQEAKEKGLIDEIMFDDGANLAASFNRSQMIPQEVIDKVRNMKDKFINQKEAKRPKQSLSFYEKKLKLNERMM